MGASSCSQILADTLMLPQIDVSVTLPMAKGYHMEAGHGFGFGIPCAVKTPGFADFDHHKFRFLLVSFGFYQCPDSVSAVGGIWELWLPLLLEQSVSQWG